MKINEDQIIKTAKLARLELSENESKEYSEQLNKIIEYVKKINELDTSDVKPAAHIMEVSNVFRDDVVRKSIDRKGIEQNAPSFVDGFFVVPKIIE
jgi:aspartyl-tRNA(Asn)/glutamyl-tRNA(Gln) amidotransferase subunit C